MNLLKEYDFDCLPLIDKQFDNPSVQEAVHSMIAHEMRTFTPQDYLAGLPFKELEFSSDLLKDELSRIEAGHSLDSLDMSRYLVDEPEDERLFENLKNWRELIRNAQIQVEHQSNRVMNADVLEASQAGLHLQTNASIERVTQGYESKAMEVNARSRSINRERQLLQERAYPVLMKLGRQRDSLLQSSYYCQQAFLHAKSILEARGLDVEDMLRRRYDVGDGTEIDENDAEHNSTVREYEAISSVVQSDDATSSAVAVEEEESVATTVTDKDAVGPGAAVGGIEPHLADGITAESDIVKEPSEGEQQSKRSRR